MTRSSLDPSYLPEADRLASGMLEVLSHIEEADMPFFNRREGESVFLGRISPLLALLDLSAATGIDRYMAVSRDLILKAAARINDNTNFQFPYPKGGMSIGYVLARLSQITGQRQYLESAVDIVDNCAGRLLHHPYISDALFDGRAGALLVLIDLYSKSRSRSLLEKIYLFANMILKNAILTSHGIYWSATNRKACEIGLGYGASGVALAMLELGRFFDNKTYYAAAEAALSYEDHFWNEDTGSWVANAGENAFFEEASDDVSYARGGIGMGLVRLRAWNLLQRPAYLHTVMATCDRLGASLNRIKAAESMYQRVDASAFLLEVFKTTGLGEYHGQARHLAESLRPFLHLPEATANTGTPSLELPAAMIHLLLQLHASTPSIFFPVTSEREMMGMEKAYPNPDLVPDEFHRRLVEKNFFRTIYILEYIDGPALKDHFLAAGPPGKAQDLFISFVGSRIPRAKPRYEQVLAEVYQLELTKARMAETHRNGALLYMKEQLDMERADAVFQLDKDQFLVTPVTLNEDVILVRTTFHPDMAMKLVPDEYDFTKDQRVTTALKPSAKKTCGREIRKTFSQNIPAFNHDRIREIHLDAIQQRFIENLEGTPEIWEWVERTISDPDFPANRQVLAFESIKSLLAAGIVTPALNT